MNKPGINISTIDETETAILALRKRKKGLIKALVLSAGIDIAISVFEFPLVVEFLGTPLIIDEIVEYFISRWVAGHNIDLKKRNRLIGFIPIPGVTSVSVQCIRELWKLNKAEKKMLAGGF